MNDAILKCYGVLIRISPGYPPVQGRLHTRYAPVRRSPPNKQACFMLPLDLHVLGLPLAFILSQDQTLHCKCKILICLSDLFIITTLMIMDTLLLRLYFNLFKELISISHLFFKRAAKLILFPILQNFFLKSFSIFPELFPI